MPEDDVDDEVDIMLLLKSDELEDLDAWAMSSVLTGNFVCTWEFSLDPHAV